VAIQLLELEYRQLQREFRLNAHSKPKANHAPDPQFLETVLVSFKKTKIEKPNAVNPRKKLCC
jgi:hypothetical protein